MARKKAPLKTKEIGKQFDKLSGWQLNKKQTQISKAYDLPTFVGGLAFAAKITVHAEIAGHHPTIELSYGKVKVTLTTHDVKGLTSNDFALAKKIDALRIA
jgi:4a-hydroxytetrahydrobiopterin dehydratase